MSRALSSAPSPAPAPAPRRSGTAAAALRHRDFRIVWLGALGSNIGTWMQNAALGAFAWNLSHQLSFVALLSYAQLAPQFFLASFAGVMAERRSRKMMIVGASLLQMAATIVIAFATADGSTSRTLLAASMFVIGIGNAYYLPSFGAIVPLLVGREDLPGAVSLQFVQLNVSRVIGPIAGLWIFRTFGVQWVFAVNAVSFVVVIAAMFLVHPKQVLSTTRESTWARVRAGFTEVWRTPILRWPIVSIAVISVFCLAFLALMPAIADERFGIGEKTVGYQWLFATFALGAALGAIAVGSFLSNASQVRTAQHGLSLFTVALVLFGVTRSQSLAYPVVFLVGLAYFVSATALSTALQKSLTEQNRGRVIAIWFMAFGGMIPWGTQLMSWFASRTNLGAMLMVGAAAAAILMLWTRSQRPGLELASVPHPEEKL